MSSNKVTSLSGSCSEVPGSFQKHPPCSSFTLSAYGHMMGHCFVMRGILGEMLCQVTLLLCKHHRVCVHNLDDTANCSPRLCGRAPSYMRSVVDEMLCSTCVCVCVCVASLSPMWKQLCLLSNYKDVFIEKKKVRKHSKIMQMETMMTCNHNPQETTVNVLVNTALPGLWLCLGVCIVHLIFIFNETVLKNLNTM